MRRCGKEINRRFSLENGGDLGKYFSSQIVINTFQVS